MLRGSGEVKTVVCTIDLCDEHQRAVFAPPTTPLKCLLVCSRYSVGFGVIVQKRLR